MKPRERILSALQCKVPDRIPIFEFLFSRKLQKNVMGYTTELFDGPSQLKLAEKLGLDAVWIPVNGYFGLEEQLHNVGETYKDEWGITYIKNGWPIMAQTDVPIKDRSDWNNYCMPDPLSPDRAKLISEASAANDKDLAILAGAVGPFTTMYWYFMDLATLSYKIYEDPELIDEMCTAYTEWVLQAAKVMYQRGKIDAFVLADDWGGTSGLLISPEHSRRFFMKPLYDMVRGLKQFNIPVIMHNDGNIWGVLDDLVNSGVNALHPIERAASMDLETVKKRYYGRLCLVGNVNNKTTMVTGTTEEVIKETLECIRIAGPGGGYIIATDHSFHDDVPFQNILTFIETAKKYGTYPLSLPK